MRRGSCITTARSAAISAGRRRRGLSDILSPAAIAILGRMSRADVTLALRENRAPEPMAAGARRMIQLRAALQHATRLVAGRLRGRSAR